MQCTMTLSYLGLKRNIPTVTIFAERYRPQLDENGLMMHSVASSVQVLDPLVNVHELHEKW